MRLALCLIAASLAAWCATPCESTPEIRDELHRFVIKDLAGEKRRAATRQVADELIAKFPTDYFILDRFERTFHYEKPEIRRAAEAKLKQIAAEHPDNADVVVVRAKSLIDFDTPRAIEVLKKSEHPWAHLALAEVYSYGKFSDRNEARKQVEAFFGACPDTLEPSALGILKRHSTPEMAKKYAPRLRERLARETNPDLLRGWDTLWNLEFQGRPATEHEALRKQIAAEVAGLEKMDVPATEPWLGLLHAGYSQANDASAMERVQDQLIAKFPKTSAAKRVLRDRFQREHPWPKPGDPEEKRQAYYKAQLAFAEAQLQRLPNEFEYLMMRFDALTELKDVKAEDVAAAGNAKLAVLRSGADWSSVPPFEWRIARGFVLNKTEIDKVPALIEEGWKSVKEREWFRSDREPEDRDRESNQLYLKAEAAKLLIDAGKMLDNLELARAAVQEIESSRADKPNQRVLVQSVLARYAEAQGRKLDALLLYRSALDARSPDVKPPKDELRENIERLYKELGGTESARALWNAGAKKVEVAGQDGRWETPTKSMPGWELPDLAGKTWKLATLEGRTLLINVWATWCGPCRTELPYLQRLYERVKDRKDITILSFNIDDEIGLVKPFLDREKLTFPVLLAKSYVEDLLPAISIPRNWIVDARGKWRAEQIGFGHDDNWENSMLERLEKTRPE